MKLSPYFDQAIQEEYKIDMINKEKGYVIYSRLREFIPNCRWKLFYHTGFIKQINSANKILD